MFILFPLIELCYFKTNELSSLGTVSGYSVLVHSRAYMLVHIVCRIVIYDGLMSDPTGVPQIVVLWLRVEWRTRQLLLYVPEQTAPSEDPRYQEAV